MDYMLTLVESTWLYAKKECGLGVITNFKEKFSIGLEMEVLVIKEQNADGMVTVSARALILRQSWEKVSSSAKMEN